MGYLKRAAIKTLAGILLATSLVSGCSSPVRKDSITTKPFIVHAGDYSTKNKASDNYAVLCDGNFENRNTEIDVKSIYEMLIKNKFKPENIYILSNSQNKNGVPYPQDGSFTKQNLEKVFSHLSSQVDHNDFFFFYVINHMEDSSNTVAGHKTVRFVIPVPGENIYDKDITRLFSELEFCTSDAIFQGCHSQSLALALVKGSSNRDNINAVYSAGYAENSTADFSGNGFGYNFVRAAMDSATGDRNKDGKYELSEIVDYAGDLKNKSNREQKRGGIFGSEPLKIEHSRVISSYHGQGLFDHLGRFHFTKCASRDKNYTNSFNNSEKGPASWLSKDQSNK